MHVQQNIKKWKHVTDRQTGHRWQY